MTRKILAVFMSLLMLMMSMAVYATEAEHTHEGCCCEEVVEVASEIQPRGEKCGYCGSFSLSSSYSYSSTTTRSVNCTHGAAGYDVYRVVTPYYKYHCTGCGGDFGTYPGPETLTLTYCPLY